MTTLKKIEAIFKEDHLGPVKEALEEAGFIGMTIASVKGRGRQGGISLEWRASTYRVDWLPKVCLSIVVKESDVEAITDLIIKVCRGDISGGGGKIFVSPVDQVIRISTGETGIDAL